MALRCSMEATSDDANRRASRSIAAVSSGTNSPEFCASSNTSRKVQRSFWKDDFTGLRVRQTHIHIDKNAVRRIRGPAD